MRKKALNASNVVAQNTAKRELKRQPPSLCCKGDAVLVRIPISEKSVKSKKTLLKSSCESRIINVDHNLHKYNIEFNDPVTSKNKKSWFKVDDITSLTKEENKREKNRQREDSSKEKATSWI